VKTIDITDATEPLASYANGVQEDFLVLTRKGKPVAALVALSDDTDLESMSLSSNPEFIALLGRSRESLRQRGGISSDEMRRRFQNVD
jgi:antitoxin (DNA-binding transcriptional repressor) of toxin-antitoxin stability system